jgi:hypothetical protein
MPECSCRQSPANAGASIFLFLDSRQKIAGMTIFYFSFVMPEHTTVMPEFSHLASTVLSCPSVLVGHPQHQLIPTGVYPALYFRHETKCPGSTSKKDGSFRTQSSKAKEHLSWKRHP